MAMCNNCNKNIFGDCDCVNNRSYNNCEYIAEINPFNKQKVVLPIKEVDRSDMRPIDYINESYR